MPQNTQYDRVKEITDQLEDGINQLFDSDQYRQWLTAMSRFHDYSLNNTILIAMQKPDATLVAGYSSWQKQFGRQVNKGEKAIRILAPTPYKQKVEVDKTDPNTGEILFNPDGSTQKEVQEILRPAFKVVNVFDVSQTEGRELPTLGVDELTGDVQQFEMFFEALKRTCPVPMEFEHIATGAKGYYHQVERRIAIQEGMSQVQTVKTAIHEMAHQKLHAIDPEKKTPVHEGENLSRNGKEVEAESVAYTICQHYGIDTSDYSFAYIAGWSQGKETPELKTSLNTIRKAASEMITEIDGHVQELAAERDARAEELAVKLDDFAETFDPYGYGDSVDDREAAVMQLKSDLLEGSNAAQGMIDYLQEIIDDGAEYAGTASLLIAQIQPFMKKTAVAVAEEQTAQQEEAAFRVGNHYLEIHEASDGSWDYTLFGHNYREVDGGQLGEPGSMTMDYAVKEILDFYQLSDQAAEPMDREQLAELTQLYDPTLTDEQIRFMGEVVEQGFDPKDYWVWGQSMDLTAQRLSSEQLTDIRYQAQVDAIPKMLYSKEQWHEIEAGIAEKADVSVYANPVLSPEQMSLIHGALNAEAQGYLTREDVLAVANPQKTVVEMRTELHTRRRDPETDITTVQEPQSEPRRYRYYSTQRPVAPGTYPKSQDNKPTEIVNYDYRQPVENGQLQAWGYLEYGKPLTEQQMSDYELKAVPAVTVRSESTTEKRTKAPKAQPEKKKSILADLHEKQAKLAGADAPKDRPKSKSKEME